MMKMLNTKVQRYKRNNRIGNGLILLSLLKVKKETAPRALEAKKYISGNMKRKSNLTYSRNNIFYSASFIAIILLFIGIEKAVGNDGTPAFFLKIAKNIPRIGRSSDAEDFFLKSSKNIPRIGKREEILQSFPENSYTLSPFGKDGQFFKATKRRIGYPPATGSDTWTWEHFPLAIEGPPELWRTLAGYSDEKAFESADGIDNEIHNRDKRAEE